MPRTAAASSASPGASGDADEKTLRARLEADAADLTARLELANLLALKQDYGGALEHLLEIVRRDRAFGDDIGRKTLLQIFSLLGPDSDLMREYRGKLSSLINR